MYYIVFQDSNGNLKILADCQDSEQAETLLQRTALEYIKEEDGLKRAKNAFVDTSSVDVTDDVVVPCGHFLVQDCDTTISLYRKSQIIHKGYFGTSCESSVERIGRYRTLIYSPKAPRTQLTTNVCPDCNTRTQLAKDAHRYSMDRDGRYSALITDLKASLFFQKMRELTDAYLREEEEEQELEHSSCCVENYSVGGYNKQNVTIDSDIEFTSFD
jgi:hypothetical protein